IAKDFPFLGLCLSCFLLHLPVEGKMARRLRSLLKALLFPTASLLCIAAGYVDAGSWKAFRQEFGLYPMYLFVSYVLVQLVVSHLDYLTPSYKRLNRRKR